MTWGLVIYFVALATVYAFQRDWWRLVYFLSSATLTISTLFMKVAR